MEAVRYVRAASRFFRATRRGEDCAAAGRREDFHYLAACFLCKRDISSNRDIFMYKGDAAFCSGECRQEQMDMDEALEAVARRQRQLEARHTSPAAVAASAARAASKAAADVEGARSGEAAAGRPPQVHRRPTIANLAARARAPMVAGKC